MTPSARPTRDTSDGANTATGLQVDAVCRWGVGQVSFTAEPGTVVVVTGGERRAVDISDLYWQLAWADNDDLAAAGGHVTTWN